MKLLLFDAAGTLIEPAEPVEEVYRRHFAEHGWVTDAAVIRSGFRETFSGLGDPEFESGGNGDEAEREWWRKVVMKTASSAGIDPRHAASGPLFDDLFGHYAKGGAWSVFPEVREVLAGLRGTNVKMAVVSNFDRRLHRVLDELDLTRWFDVVLTSADVSARKPSPVLLQRAMDHFSVSAGNAYLVGDSEFADGGAGRAAGVEVFVLNRPATTLREFADHLVENFS